MSFKIANYDYVLDGYTKNPFSHSEYKTYSIHNKVSDEWLLDDNFCEL